MFNKKGLNACYDIAKMEYERELQKNEKLDNKINITLTFCGVIFLYSLKYLNFYNLFMIETKYFNHDFIIFIKTIISIFMILVCFYYSKAMYRLLQLIETRTYKQYDLNIIFEEDLPNKPEEKVLYYNTSMLTAATNENIAKNENRANTYNEALNNIKKVLIFIALIEILTFNFLK